MPPSIAGSSPSWPSTGAANAAAPFRSNRIGRRISDHTIRAPRDRLFRKPICRSQFASTRSRTGFERVGIGGVRGLGDGACGCTPARTAPGGFTLSDAALRNPPRGPPRTRRSGSPSRPCAAFDVVDHAVNVVPVGGDRRQLARMRGRTRPLIRDGMNCFCCPGERLQGRSSVPARRSAVASGVHRERIEAALARCAIRCNRRSDIERDFRAACPRRAQTVRRDRGRDWPCPRQLARGHRSARTARRWQARSTSP